jgi:hypothetical protein
MESMLPVQPHEEELRIHKEPVDARLSPDVHAVQFDIRTNAARKRMLCLPLMRVACFDDAGHLRLGSRNRLLDPI